MRISLIGILFLLVSCATAEGRKNTVLSRATFDLGCSKDNLSIQELGTASIQSATYGVEGCGKKGTYIVSGDSINGYNAILNTQK